MDPAEKLLDAEKIQWCPGLLINVFVSVPIRTREVLLITEKDPHSHPLHWIAVILINAISFRDFKIFTGLTLPSYMQENIR